MAEQDKVAEAQRLIAEMQSKYGGAAPKAAEAPPKPAPAPAPQQKQEQPGSLLMRAAGLLGGRKEQIDKAAGYACGGKVKAHADGGEITDDDGADMAAAHQAGLAAIEQGKTKDAQSQQQLASAFSALTGYARGGKVKSGVTGTKVKTIKGPGTSTSDSIPAKVKETGEKILVSNGERILSKKQDQLLGKIAKMLGYESTDELLASGTGRPVGPTMKDGKKAARYGANGEWIPDPEDDKAPIGGHWATPGTPIPEGQRSLVQQIINEVFSAQNEKVSPNTRSVGLDKIPEIFADAAKANNTANTKTYEQIRAERAGGTPVMPQPTLLDPSAQNYSNEGRSVPNQITSQNRATLAPVVSPSTITNDSAKTAYESGMKRSGGIFGTMDLAGQNDRLAKQLGYANAADFLQQKATAPAPGAAILGEVSPGVSRADLENEAKTRKWAVDDALLKYGPAGAHAMSQMLGIGSHEQIARMANNAAMYGHDVNAQRAAGHDQTLLDVEKMRQAGNPNENRLKAATAAEHEQMARLRGELLDPNVPDARKEQVKKYLLAIGGKNTDQSNIKIAEETYPDPNNPMNILKRTYAVGAGADQVPIVPIGARQPEQIPPADKREVGKVYPTPKGPLRWTGNGWSAA